MLVDEGAPYAVFREDGEVREFVAPAAELVDDGVAEVGDEDGHRGHGDEGPYDEEATACVGFGGEIPCRGMSITCICLVLWGSLP